MKTFKKSSHDVAKDDEFIDAGQLDVRSSRGMIFFELKRKNYNDLEQMLSRKNLIQNESLKNLNKNCIAAAAKSHRLPPAFYKNSDTTVIKKSLIPGDVKVKVTIDDIRWRKNLLFSSPAAAWKFTDKSFFQAILGFRGFRIGLGSLRNNYSRQQETIYMENQSSLHELIKFIGNVIVLMEVL